jgi:hypothetical protein
LKMRMAQIHLSILTSVFILFIVEVTHCGLQAG